MNAVMLSIRPEWCEKIASGKKTIEIRKSKPKLETPFKCYIYCAKDKYGHLYVNNTGNCREEFPLLYTKHNATSLVPKGYINGMVIGEFICREILPMNIWVSDPTQLKPLPFPRTGLTDVEIINYLGNGGDGYGWHISQLKIYDEPKELSEFLVEADSTTDYPPLTKMKRPPQSWCYVEGLALGGGEG